MNKWLKEGLWMAGLILLPLIVLFSNASWDGVTLDINIHDTYFVMDVFTLYAILSLVLWFPVYFIRILLARFANNQMNMVFMVVSFCLAIFLTALISHLEAVSSPGWTVYPPLSALQQEIPASGPGINTGYLASLQGVIILLIGYTGYRTGRNLKHS